MAASDEPGLLQVQRRLWRAEHVGQITALITLAALVWWRPEPHLALMGRGAAVYGFLMAVFRISGKRSLAPITAFDFILLLIVSEAVQNAMVGEDSSVTGGFVLVLTLVSLDFAMRWIAPHHPFVSRVVDDLPVVLLEHGTLISDRMKHSRVGEDDILEAARRLHGLERLDQIKYALLERSGGISIIPAGRWSRDDARAPRGSAHDEPAAGGG